MHECPDCGQAWCCGADIDDCMNNFEEDVMNCTHYLQCESEMQSVAFISLKDLEAGK